MIELHQPLQSAGPPSNASDADSARKHRRSPGRDDEGL